MCDMSEQESMTSHAMELWVTRVHSAYAHKHKWTTNDVRLYKRDKD